MPKKVENHILIIDKYNSLRATLAQHFRQQGFCVSEADQPIEVLQALSDTSIRLVLLGLEELKRDGIAILRMIKGRNPKLAIITINSGDQLELSIESMHLGVLDEFLIPFDLDTLLVCVREALGASGRGVPTGRDA